MDGSALARPNWNDPGDSAGDHAALALGWFPYFWRWKSRKRAGRPRIDRGLRDLIRQMSQENPLWGASRIHGELLMLGFEVAQSTVSGYMTRGG